jgi:WD40 repeat protein
MKCEPTENNQVTCIQYSPDDLYLASGFRNGKVYLWKASNIEHIDTVQLEQDIVDVDFSTCGKYLAAATRLGILSIFESETQEHPCKAEIGDQS